ncbi:hypothetical protein GE061_006346 [Apolygus lucorum]|uniref:Uncharacterized protein n=1 Tax=Apolygus lucorum TaxID=248454 RepID=A0A6A4JDG0_APOLU|nr:hypothetical protein GE061_006346 [Apolygus lucorum]
MGADVLLVLGLATVLSVLVYKWTNRRFLKLAEQWPGPPGWPLVGNALEFIGTPNRIFETLCEYSQTLDDLARVWVGPRLLLFIYHPADIELILSSHEHLDKSVEYDFLRPWLGNGLLTSTGDKWKSHRRVIAPTFHLNVLRGFIGKFNENGKEVVRKMKQERGNLFDAHDYMSECTVRTLLETVMGFKIETTKERKCYDYAMAVMKLCDIIHLRHMKGWLRPNMLFKLSHYNVMQKDLLSVVHGITQKVFSIKRSDLKHRTDNERNSTQKAELGVQLKNDEKLQTISSELGFSFGQASGLRDDLDTEDIGEKKRGAFLETIMEKAQNEEAFDYQEVQEQLDTIMFEGHDTTAAASSFFLCVMAARPDIQEKCFSELYGIFGDSDRDVTFQDTMEMKYLERCMMETLRLYPPVPAIARRVNREVKLASRDLTIPAGSTVIVATYALHRRSDIYPNPEEFNPDNFLPEKSASRHFYSFIPFSAGPRSCVGRKYAMLKLKIILATILRNFRIQPGLKEEDWKFQADIIFKRADGFKINIESRTVDPTKNNST